MSGPPSGLCSGNEEFTTNGNDVSCIADSDEDAVYGVLYNGVIYTDSGM